MQLSHNDTKISNFQENIEVHFSEYPNWSNKGLKKSFAHADGCRKVSNWSLKKGVARLGIKLTSFNCKIFYRKV